MDLAAAPQRGGGCGVSGAAADELELAMQYVDTYEPGF